MSGGLSAVVAFATAFLLGSFPFGLWWGRLFGGIDVREHGSRNLGAANVFRLLGPVHGITVLLLDAAKGAAAVLAARYLTGNETVAILAGLFAVLGHLFSPWVAFRGGKGVAAGLGAWLILAPAATGLALALFALVLAGSRRVSVGSLAASLALVPLVYFLSPDEALPLRTGLAVITAGLVWLRHRGNLIRLAAGEEPPLWGKQR
jgi:glycerol-3-phosphate acyltransferase PlsY